MRDNLAYMKPMGQIYKVSLAEVCSPLRDRSPGWISSCGRRQPASVAAFRSLLVVSPGSHCSGAWQLLVALYPMCSEGMPVVWLHILASHIVMAFDCLRGEVWSPLFQVNQKMPNFFRLLSFLPS